MPMLKICTEQYNGVDYNIVLIQGKVVKDGVVRTFGGGKTVGKTSVVGKKNEDGTTTFVGINGWGDDANVVGRLKKGQNILVIGRLHSREYEGKKYWDCDADYISLSGVSVFSNTAPTQPVKLQEIEEDGELPF